MHSLVGLNHFTVPVAILVSNIDHDTVRAQACLGATPGGLAALEKILRLIAIGRDARVLTKFVEPTANCALCTTD
jgi:hypothetical protein